MWVRRDTSQVFQIKVTLRGSKPPIWRRIQVRGSTTLPVLHDTLQVVMGWHNGHLHAFTAKGVEYGVPDPDWLDTTVDESHVRLDRLVAGPKDRIRYEYDFGDGWIHNLVVEKVLPPEPDMRYPVVLAGRRACPPEDVGGIWGYATYLAARSDPNHPEHETYTQWDRRAFDPAAFDVAAVNRRLGHR